MNRSPETNDVLPIDALLAKAAAQPSTAELGLRNRILQQLPVKPAPLSLRLWDWLGKPWPGTAVALAPLLLGFVLGSSWTNNNQLSDEQILASFSQEQPWAGQLGEMDEQWQQLSQGSDK